MKKNPVFRLVLQTVRKQRGLTQQDLAEAIGLSVESVSKLERGVTKPRMETAVKVSQVLKVPLNDLVGYVADNKESQRIVLETKLVEIARKVDVKTLKMMVKQFEAISKNLDD